MRYATIDLLRTLAIVLMVVVHFLENLAGVNWAPAGLGAPLFGFLMGVSYRIWQRSAEARGLTDSAIDQSTLRRAVFLFLLGLAFNVLVWLPEDTFNWDVLTLLATAYALLALVRSLPPAVPVVFCAMVYLLSPVLRAEAGYDDYWLLGYYDAEMTLRDVILGYLVTGYFPVFPWVIFPIVGYLIAVRVVPDRPQERLNFSAVAALMILGVGCVVLSLTLRYARAWITDPRLYRLITGWSMFPASPEYLAGVLGVILLLFGLGLWLIDGRGLLKGLPGVVSVAQTLSKYSLTVYIFHHIVHLWPMWILATIRGLEPTTYWQRAMAWQWAAILAAVFLVLCYLLLRWVEKAKLPTVESALRWFAD
jgi:uncharacterized membrane protein